MTDIEILKACHVTKLSTAARMAGLKFKNGAPGYDKAGIIEQLTFRPSVLRATIATIQNMDRGTVPTVSVNPFIDDLEDDLPLPPVKTPPAAIEALPAAFTPLVDTSPLRSSIDSALRMIGGLRADLDGVRGDYINGTTCRRIVRTEIDIELSPILAAVELLKSAVVDLQTRAPIQFIIEGKTLPTVSNQHKKFPALIRYLQINRRVILTGSAGTGKSLAVKKAAEVLEVPFYLQTPVTQTHELLGYRDAGGTFHETPLFQAYTKGGLILMDESDASLPDALLSANPIFDGNGFAVFGDGKLHSQHKDFLAVFNMNTDGNGASMQYSGRNRLDGATLARFGVRINWDIDPMIERSMAGDYSLWLAVVIAVRALMETRQIQDVNATPRHTKTGAMLLAGGVPAPDVLRDVLRSGALSEIWPEVERLPSVRAFLQGA